MHFIYAVFPKVQVFKGKIVSQNTITIQPVDDAEEKVHQALFDKTVCNPFPNADTPAIQPDVQCGRL